MSTGTKWTRAMENELAKLLRLELQEEDELLMLLTLICDE